MRHSWSSPLRGARRVVTCRAAWLLVEIRIEDPNLGDALDREPVAAVCAPNGLGRGRIVDAEGLPLVHAYVRVNPGDLVGEVALDHRQAGLGAGLVHRNLQSVRKLSLDQIAWHGGVSWLRSWTPLVHTIGDERAAAEREPSPYCAPHTLTLGHPYPGALGCRILWPVPPWNSWNARLSSRN